MVRKYSEPLDDMANMLITGNERIEAEHMVLRTCDICKSILIVLHVHVYCTCKCFACTVVDVFLFIIFYF